MTFLTLSCDVHVSLLVHSYSFVFADFMERAVSGETKYNITPEFLMKRLLLLKPASEQVKMMLLQLFPKHLNRVDTIGEVKFLLLIVNSPAFLKGSLLLFKHRMISMYVTKLWSVKIKIKRENHISILFVI